VKLFIFNVPCHEVWTVSTLASSEPEAWENIRHRNYTKLHAAEGNTKSGKTELASVMELEGEGQ
jgi:hypothetical protein